MGPRMILGIALLISAVPAYAAEVCCKGYLWSATDRNDPRAQVETSGCYDLDQRDELEHETLVHPKFLEKDGYELAIARDTNPGGGLIAVLSQAGRVGRPKQRIFATGHQHVVLGGETVDSYLFRMDCSE